MICHHSKLCKDYLGAVLALFNPPPLHLDLQATPKKLLGFRGSTAEVEVVFGFTTDHTIFAVPSASDTDSFSKETFSTCKLRFDDFSASGLEGAHGRVLSLLAFSLKNSLILGCDCATSSIFRGMICVTFLDLMILDIVIGLVFFKLEKAPKTRLSKLAGGH